MHADGHGLPQEMQLHAALLQQKLAVQREIERAVKEEDELQRAIEEAQGINSNSGETAGGNVHGADAHNNNDDDNDDDGAGRGGGDGGGIKGGHGRSGDGSSDGQGGSGDEAGEADGAGGAPTRRRSSASERGGEGGGSGVPGKSSVQMKSSGFVSTRRVDRLQCSFESAAFPPRFFAIHLNKVVAAAVDNRHSTTSGLLNIDTSSASCVVVRPQPN